MNVIYKVSFETPMGRIVACSTDKGVCSLEFYNPEKYEKQQSLLKKQLGTKDVREVENNHLAKLKEELAEYFDGKRKDFTVALDLVGTDFQKQVWDELLRIPYGKIISYLEQSQRMGNAKAVRAVANANGRNKISIVVPCHRVIGSNGALTGYASGLDNKRFLLSLENIPFSK